MLNTQHSAPTVRSCQRRTKEFTQASPYDTVTVAPPALHAIQERAEPHAELWEALFADRSNMEIRNQIATLYVDWVWKIVSEFIRLYPDSRRSREELFSDGFWGLLIAIERFRPGEARFTTYSIFWIRQKLYNGFGRSTMPQKKATKVSRQRFQLQHTLGHRANDYELASGLGLDEPRLAAIFRNGGRCSRVLSDSPTDSAGRSRPPSHNLEVIDEFESFMSHVADNRKTLVLEHLANDVPLRHLAEQRGIVGERVRQIVVQAVADAHRKQRMSDNARIKPNFSAVLPPPIETLALPGQRMSPKEIAATTRVKLPPKRAAQSELVSEEIEPVLSLLSEETTTELNRLKSEEAFFAKCAAKANIKTPHGRSVQRALERIQSQIAALRSSGDLLPAA